MGVQGMVAGRGSRASTALGLACCLALCGSAAGGVRPAAATKSALAAASLLVAGTNVEGRLVAVGERGHVVVSDDGASWRQAEVPTATTLTAVRFSSPKLGWAVGHEETILRTRDGGEHWERARTSSADERPLLDVWFRTPERGFAVGAYGLFLETTDGGGTWGERKVSPEDWHLNRIVPAEGGRVYLVGEAGRLLRSDDGGATWKPLASPYNGSFYGGLALGGETLLVFGLRGHLYRTEDGGRTWQELRTGTDGLLSDAAHLPDGRIVVVGTSGAVLVSADGGRSFALTQIADRHGLSGVVPGPGGGALGFGERGVEKLEVGAGPLTAASTRSRRDERKTP